MTFSNKLDFSPVELDNLAVRTAYSYRRISTPEQQKGTGLARQTDAALDYCRTHNLRLDDGLKLSDEGVSAFKGDNVLRGKLGEFLRLVEKGKVKRGSVLLVESIDRISRQNVMDAQELFLGIVNRGITLVTLMDGQEYSRAEIQKNPWKLMVSLSVMIRANEESETKSKRVSAARQKRRELAASGKAFEVFTPPWCDFKDGRFVPNESKVRIVRGVFEEYLKGKGAMAIASTFNNEGIAYFGRKETQWYKKVVQDLLKDKRVIGHAHWIDKDDYFPRVVKPEVFNSVQFRLAERTNKGGQTGKGIINIFAGVMRCGCCGGSVNKTRCVNSQGYEYFYLVCENARTGKKSCQYRSILFDAVEQSFLYLIRFHPWFNETLQETFNPEEDQVEPLKGELLETERQLEKLTNLIIHEDNPPKSIVGKLRDLEAKADKVRSQIVLEEGRKASRVENAAMDEEFLGSLPEKMKDPDFRLKVREVVRSMVKRITLHVHNGTPHYHVERTNGKLWSVVFLNTKREKLEFQISRGLTSTVDPQQIILYSMNPKVPDAARAKVEQLFGVRLQSNNFTSPSMLKRLGFWPTGKPVSR